jgi:signal transduction histidine kinase
MTVVAIVDELRAETGRVLRGLLDSALRATGAESGCIRLWKADGTVDQQMGDGCVASPPGALGGVDLDRHVADIRLADARGELHLVASAGTTFTERERWAADGLAAMAGRALDDARTRSLGERRRRWLEALGNLTGLLLPPITLPEALECIADAVHQASGARAGMIIQLPASGRPFLAARSGLREELDEEETFECQVAAREVVETGVVTETSLVSGRVALLAPLRAQLTLPGALVIVHADRPDAEEPVLLASFADHAGLVLDRTQALEDRQKLAVISDRDRIARDLHDVVIQRLFASGLKLHSTVALADDAALRERLESTVRDLDQTIRDIRSSIFDLTSRPRSSVRSDLADLVRDLVPALGFAPSVHMTGAVDKAIDPKLQEQLGSVIREALTNVAKHAGATAASVELQLTPTHLRLRVSDDGVGMPEGRPERGLRTIRRRAVLLGGDLDLWPNDPRGTSLVWAVPLPQEP